MTRYLGPKKPQNRVTQDWAIGHHCVLTQTPQREGGTQSLCLTGVLPESGHSALPSGLRGLGGRQAGLVATSGSCSLPSPPPHFGVAFWVIAMTLYGGGGPVLALCWPQPG